MDDGTLETATRLTPDVVRMTGRFPDDTGEGYYVDIAQGIYTLVYQSIFENSPDPATRASYSYPEPPAQMPAPAPDSTVTLDSVGLDSGNFFSETQTLSFGAVYTLDIGGCSYDAIDVDAVYQDQPDEVETFTLLPDLSLSFLVAYADPMGRQDYRPVRIFTP